MSVLMANNLKICSSVIVNNILKRNSHAASKAKIIPINWDIKIIWKKPKTLQLSHPSKTGDGGLTFLDTKGTDPAYQFSECEEYKDANETVKTLLTLDYFPIGATYEKNWEKIKNLIARHQCDEESMELQISKVTQRLVYLQELMAKRPRRHLRYAITKLSTERHKLLTELQSYDYKRFEWLLEKLNIIYKAPCDDPFTISRENSIRKLTEKYHDQVISDKLNAYRRELEAQQKKFYTEKVEKLIHIRNEELALGLQPTVTEDDIDATRKMAAQLK